MNFQLAYQNEPLTGTIPTLSELGGQAQRIQVAMLGLTSLQENGSPSISREVLADRLVSFIAMYSSYCIGNPDHLITTRDFAEGGLLDQIFSSALERSVRPGGAIYGAIEDAITRSTTRGGAIYGAIEDAITRSTARGGAIDDAITRSTTRGGAMYRLLETSTEPGGLIDNCVQNAFDNRDAINESKEENKRSRFADDPIVAVPNRRGLLPTTFPATIDAFFELGSTQINTLCRFYGISRTGTVLVRRNKVAKHCGIGLYE